MQKLIFFISFFIYSGYYAGLAIIFALNLSELSRFYSVPLRIVLTLAMIYILRKSWQNLMGSINSIYLFIYSLFWILYILKVLYTENYSNIGQLSKEWYEFIFFGITYVFLPFLTYMAIDLKKYSKTILNALILSGFIMGVVSTYLYGNLLVSGVGRISLITYETGQDVLSPLALSYAGVLTISLCAFQLVFEKELSKLKRVYLIAGISFSFVMFLLGSSRGSVLALAITIPLFIYYSPLKRKLFLTCFVVLLIPIIVWLVEISGSNIFERIGNTSKDKGGGRDKLWEDALNHFVDNPIFGGFVEIGGIYPHNLIVELLMATGLIGTFLLSLIIYKGFKVGFYLANLNVRFLFILVVMIQGFVQHSFTAGFYTSTLLFVPIAMALNIENKKNRNE